MFKKINFKIEGMHCSACKTLIETEVDVLSGVKTVNVDYSTGATMVEFDESKIKQTKIFSEIEKLNYKVKKDSDNSEKKALAGKKSLMIGLFVPILIIIVVIVFFTIRDMGGFELLSKLNGGNVGYGLLFVIGLLAGFHCIGMCGGLVVAYSAIGAGNEQKKKKSFLPHLQYNFGRLISYTVIGGILGTVGAFFGINPTLAGIVLLVAGLLMMIMGLSFLSNHQLLKKLKIKAPSFVAKFLYNQKYSEHPKAPFVIGLLNGFMPCGPLQAVQLYALTTGSLMAGALSMGIYALGTIPMMFGFGVFISKIGDKYIHKMIKFSGILIILLAMAMFNRGLNNFGGGIMMSRGGNYQGIEKSAEDFQVVNMDLTYAGYSPNVLYIKKGIPVRWVINVKQMSGCTNAIMIEPLGIKKDLVMGENIIEFVPPTTMSEIKFSCWMRMVWGKFVVE